jgi:NAD-dependent DNA ligase
MLKILSPDDKDDELEEVIPSTNLRNLANYIKGDISHCTICSSKFSENNKPRVLFCGDCLCEDCIKRSIVRFKSSILDPSNDIPGVLEKPT